MLIHYIKIAFRNLWKYKTQSMISIVGLAAGFTCFALATLWIQYEMTYDTFHPDHDRMFLVERTNNTPFGASDLPYPLVQYMKETFPEVEDACAIQCWEDEVKKDGIKYKGNTLRADTLSARFFNIQILEGSKDFLIPDSKSLAVTEAFGRQLAPDGNIIGLKVMYDEEEWTVCAVVKEWEGHSNFPFVMVKPIKPDDAWGYISFRVFAKLKANVDASLFSPKIAEHGIRETSIEGMRLIPLSGIRYKADQWGNGVKFEYIFLFAAIGILVIVCVFINYFTLFSNRFRIRGKELAVRKLCGANQLSLFALLFTEFFLTLLLALAVGLVLIRLASVSFFELSGMESTSYRIYGESFIYILLITLIASLFFYLFLRILHKQTLSALIKRPDRKKQNLSLLIQLFISIGFVFVTAVIVKQVHYLYTTDLGFEYRNTASLSFWAKELSNEELGDRLKEMPEVEQFLFTNISLLPRNSTSMASKLNWDGKPEDMGDHETTEIIHAGFDWVDFYGLRLMTGELLTEHDLPEAVLITEQALKVFGWTEPIGKTITKGNATYRVKGVVRDVYYASPMVAPRPMIFLNNTNDQYSMIWIFRYQPGTEQEIELKLHAKLNEEYPEALFFMRFANDTYDEYMKSENALLKVLGFAALVCIIVSLFGFYSVVSLVCESRRREIAIRKINGATMQIILLSFVREYAVILVLSAVPAFALSYIIVKRWLEHYVLQTDIPFWLYFAIFIAFALIIAGSVGWQIYRTSRENPAEELKAKN